jgi:hypothetical protein
MTRLEQSDNRLWVKVNVGIDKHKVSTVSLLVKTGDGYVTRAVDKGLVFGSIQHHLNSIHCTYTLELQQ